MSLVWGTQEGCPRKALSIGMSPDSGTVSHLYCRSPGCSDQGPADTTLNRGWPRPLAQPVSCPAVRLGNSPWCSGPKVGRWDRWLLLRSLLVSGGRVGRWPREAGETRGGPTLGQEVGSGSWPSPGQGSRMGSCPRNRNSEAWHCPLHAEAQGSRGSCLQLPPALGEELRPGQPGSSLLLFPVSSEALPALPSSLASYCPV